MLITPAYLTAALPALGLAPITAQQAGVLTNGSATITIPSTTGLAAGQPVYGPNIPDGSLIVTIGSGYITINQNVVLPTPLTTGTFLLTFTYPSTGRLASLIQDAQAAAESYVGYPLESATTEEYYSGNNYPDIILRRPFVTNVASVVQDIQSGYGNGNWGQFGLTIQNGVCNGTTSITGLASTSGFTVGQMVSDGYPATGTLIPLPCWIAAINSPTSITLTSAALKSGTFPITFAAGFAQSLQLQPGVGYALVMEGVYNGIVRSGLLRCLQGQTGAGLGPWGWGGQQYGRTFLTPVGPRNWGWPISQGGVQVVYTAGFVGLDGGPLTTATPTVPADICGAIVSLCQFIAIVTPQGGQTVTNESLGKYSYGRGAVNMATSAIAAAGELGTTRQILTRYRDLGV